MINPEYLEAIKDRAKKSHVYQKFQLTGLTIAEILGDSKHRAIFIKLAQNHRESDLILLARNIAEKRSVSNKGAYFMKMLAVQKAEGKIKETVNNKQNKRIKPKTVKKKSKAREDGTDKNTDNSK